jgi:hypothetical protein
MKELYGMKYDANFTVGGLLHNEFLALENIISKEDFEEALKTEESLNQYIGINTIAGRKRIIVEIRRRLRHTPQEFWPQFYLWNENEQKLALFYVCLETYKIVFDIHWEVAILKYKTGDTLDAYDVSMFLDAMASKDDVIDSWSASTAKKINTQYRKSLSDAGLLRGNQLHKPLAISESFWNYFKKNNTEWFLEACFIV